MDAKNLKSIVSCIDHSVFPDEEVIEKLTMLAGHEPHARDIEMTYAICDKSKFEALGDKVFGYFLLKELYATKDRKVVTAAFSQYASNAALNFFLYKLMGKFKPKLADLFEIYIQCLNELNLSPALLIQVYVKFSDTSIVLSSSMVDGLNRAMVKRKEETSIKMVSSNYKGAVLEFSKELGVAVECKTSASATGYSTTVTLHGFLGQNVTATADSTSSDDSEQLAFKEMEELLHAIMDANAQ